MVRTSIRSPRVRAGVFAEYSSQFLPTAQGQGVVNVLEKNCAGCANRSDKGTVLLTDVDMLVDETVAPLASNVPESETWLVEVWYDVGASSMLTNG